jgi:hypothetical protein
VHAIVPGPRSNKLLAALPHKDFQLLVPVCTENLNPTIVVMKSAQNGA